MYASFPYPVHKVKENVIIKEHLCCKKFTACLNLFLKTINIIKLILGIWVYFWITRTTNTEITCLFNQFYKL